MTMASLFVVMAAPHALYLLRIARLTPTGPLQPRRSAS